MAKVMIEETSYEMVREAIDRVFSLFPLVCTGKKVLLKPNVLRGSTPDEGITTHPAVLRAVVERVEAMSPKMLIVGDNPGIFCYGANEDSFARTGLLEAAKGHYMNIGNESEKMAFNPDFLPEVSVSLIVKEADIIISLPKFKTHGLTVMTGAIKNSYGFLPGAQKARLHKEAGSAVRFHEMIVDVFRIRVPDLFIMDAIVGMEGSGPASPDLRDIGLLLASDNAVAMDGVVAFMMGCDPGRLRFLQKAKEEGLGDYDLNTIEIIGRLRRIPGFKLPPLGGEAILDNEGMMEVLLSKTVLKPSADPEWCTGCGACVNQCPVSALSMVESVPVVDGNACIACFCCQEVCPEKAITLK
ncbi:MAG TPA: DUF362 domain-containing protein [Syntrophorhabdaceae bacterium]|jgi:uncharacterized protein (DUF362 family)/Pyruvate/2-oxoacid:ferredoxin oxidoreductase delta subunit